MITNVVSKAAKQIRTLRILTLPMLGLLFLATVLLAVFQPKLFEGLDRALFKDSAVRLQPNLEYWAADETVDLSNIVYKSAKYFQPLPGDNTLSFGTDEPYVWLRFKLRDMPSYRNTEIYYLYFDDSFFDRWVLYIPNISAGDVRYTAAAPGDAKGPSAIYHHAVIPRQALADQYFYLRFHRENIAHVLKMNTDTGFYETQLRLIIFMVVCMGFLLGMIVMNLMLSYSTRERYYLYHAIFLCCALLLLASLSAISRWLTGRTYGMLVLRMQLVTVMAAAYFCYAFLDIPKRGRVLVLSYRAALAAGTVLAVVMFALPYPLAVRVGQAGSLSMLLFVAAVTAVLFAHDPTLSARFLLGIAIAAAASVLSTMTVLGLIPLYYITFYAIFPAFALEALLFSSGITRVIQTHETKNRLLQHEMNTDALTGLKNRHYLESGLKPEVLALEAQGKPISLVMFDIDFFKVVNDTYGHDIGDAVLTTLSQLAMGFFRATDTLVRWGGEEFAVFLPTTTLKQAAEVGERFRRRVEGRLFEPAGVVTVSLGVAEKAPDESFGQWFKRADTALYAAKHLGRNRVEISYPLSYNTLGVCEDWSAADECGHPLIDSQHKQLFQAVQQLVRLYQASTADPALLPALNALLADVTRHFADEENVLGSPPYPYLDEHRLEHRRLLKHATVLHAAVLQEAVPLTHLLEFVVGELVIGHMRQEDIHFFRYLASQRETDAPTP